MKCYFKNIINFFLIVYTLLFLFVNFAYSQCNITATANNINNDTVYICSGNPVDFNSTGGCDLYLMTNNFNDGTIGNGWSSNATPMFNNPCTFGPDGSGCLWIGPASNFPRELVTIPFSVTTSCTICFDMIYSVQGVPSPCEGPDLPQEGVHLQWSNDGGATWTDIQYWAPNGGHDPNLTTWHNHCANVPVGGANIQFRWYQSNTSGNIYDHWGIDNVIITCPQTETVWWTGYNGFSFNNYNPPSFVPAQNGWYTVHITDGTYINTDSIYIFIYPPLSATITPSNPTLCYGETSVTITSSGLGGTPPYTYLWNTGATTQSITGGAGNYTLLVNDASGCAPAVAATTITANSIAITANAGPDQTLCNTNPNVTLTGSVTAATGGIWMGGTGIFSPSNTSLNATYIPSSAEVISGTVELILVTTGNGTCPADTDAITINFVTFQGNLAISANQVNCYGGSNGTATVNIIVGVPPYSYIWNNAQTGQTATGLSQGIYTVTVTDGNGCTNTSSVTITQPQPLTALISATDVSCFGLSDGVLVASAFGGTPDYSFLWSNGFSGINNTGLTAGNYNVTVTDANGCQTIISDTVKTPDLLTAIINTSINVSCAGGSDGSATLLITGGTPNYNYNWSSGAGTSQTASGLVAGTYLVTVADSQGCQTNISVLITQPPALSINLSTNNVLCYGGNNGSASVVVTGGTPGYAYQWSPYGGNTPNANNLTAGNYTIIVTDNNGCQQTVIATITQPPPLSVVLNNVSNVLCFGGTTGSASISVTGGTPGYSYQWSPYGGSSPIATGLQAGNYTVSVTDANACVSQLIVFVSQPASSLNATFLHSDVNCYGEQTGSITANPTGGTVPYSYLWQPLGSIAQTISNIGAGTYFVTITDANGCSLLNSISITQPGGILITTSTDSSTCGTSNGSATVTLTGGTPPYYYIWSDPSAQVTSTAVGLASGLYHVTITDALGCSQTATVALNDILGPAVIMAAIQNVSCFGGHDGTATVSVSGGSPPYTYQWSPYGGNTSTGTGLGAGTFVVLVSDILGCQGVAVTNPEITQPLAISISSTQINITCTGANNGSVNLSVNGGTAPYTYLWSNGSTIPNPIALSPGVYQVIVTDSHNCQDSSVVTFVEPTPLVVSINTFQDVSCFGGYDGSATATVSGGTPPYNFSWSPGGATSQTAFGLSAGNHTVFITDSKGCYGSATIFLSQPSSNLTLSSGFTNPQCYNGNDGSAWVIANGGTPPYNYNWSPIGGTDDTASNFQAGIYYVTVTDQYSCQSFVPVIISQPVAVDISITNFSNVSCFGGSNGTALASVSGGVPPYQYYWSTGSISPGIIGLIEGPYFVTVTDSRGCFDTSSITIHAPSQALSVTVSGQNISCNGFEDGSATATVLGGTEPYTYVCVPASQFNPTATNLIAGTYTVSITDKNGCQTYANITLNQPQPLYVTVSEDLPVSCNGTNTGAASANVSGGTWPYDYNWTNGQTTQTDTGLIAGTYGITITDANGCTTSTSVIITEPTALLGVIISQTDVSCYNGSNGIATAGVTGGTPPYTIVWGTTPQQNGQVATNLSSGYYTITITDNNGCTDTVGVSFINPSQIIAYVTGQTIICLGDSVTITASASGGAGNYLFFWNQGLGLGTSKIVSPGNETSYIVNAYDQSGCQGVEDTITVNVLTLFPQNVDVFANSPVCAGTPTSVYATATVSSFDTITYSWSDGLGPGPGPFIVTPTQETTYMLTVTNTCGLSLIDSVPVYFAPPPTIYFYADATQGCMPLTINFTDSSFTTFDDINSWTWHFSDGTSSILQNPTHTFETADTFYVWLNLETSGGCISSSAGYPLPIYVFSIPDASFEVNATTLYLPNDPVVCSNTSIGGTAYLWNFGDGSTSIQTSPTHNYNDLGQYLITLFTTNMYGCVDSASISVNATGDIVFPNVFTPDINNSTDGKYDANDLTNHVFFPYATGISEFKMTIFNRWGELIFETNNIDIGWDGYYRGHLSQEDVYVFKASAVFVDGRKVEKIGDILLLR